VEERIRWMRISEGELSRRASRANETNLTSIADPRMIRGEKEREPSAPDDLESNYLFIDDAIARRWLRVTSRRGHPPRLPFSRDDDQRHKMVDEEDDPDGAKDESERI